MHNTFFGSREHFDHCKYWSNTCKHFAFEEDNNEEDELEEEWLQGDCILTNGGQQHVIEEDGDEDDEEDERARLPDLVQAGCEIVEWIDPGHVVSSSNPVKTVNDRSVLLVWVMFIMLLTYSCNCRWS